MYYEVNLFIIPLLFAILCFSSGLINFTLKSIILLRYNIWLRFCIILYKVNLYITPLKLFATTCFSSSLFFRFTIQYLHNQIWTHLFIRTLVFIFNSRYVNFQSRQFVQSMLHILIVFNPNKLWKTYFYDTCCKCFLIITGILNIRMYYKEIILQGSIRNESALDRNKGYIYPIHNLYSPLYLANM